MGLYFPPSHGDTRNRRISVDHSCVQQAYVGSLCMYGLLAMPQLPEDPHPDACNERNLLALMDVVRKILDKLNISPALLVG